MWKIIIAHNFAGNIRICKVAALCRLHYGNTLLSSQADAACDLLNLEQGLKRIPRQPLNYAKTEKRKVKYCTVCISEYPGSRERLNL
jgi:hypothetical protein